MEGKVKNRASQSTLQNRILLYMDGAAFKSITDLAASLKAHRSSVSRAIHSLLETGLVTRSGSRWDLTAEGHSEIAKLRTEISEKATKTSKAASRLIEQSALAGLSLGYDPASVLGIGKFSQSMAWNNSTIFDSINRLVDSVAGINALAALSHSIQPKIDASMVLDSAISTQSILSNLTDFEQTRNAIFGSYSSAIFDSMMPSQEAMQALQNSFMKWGDDVAQGIQAQLFGAADIQAAVASLPATVGIESPLAQFSSSFLDAIAATATIPSAAEMLAGPSWQIKNIFNQPAAEELCSRLSVEAFASLTQSQRLSLAAIEGIALSGKTVATAFEGLNSVNRDLSRMIGSVGDIRIHALIGDNITLPIAIQIQDLAAVTRTYKGYLADTFRVIESESENYSWEMELLWPTRATSSYIDSVRTGVVYWKEDEDEDELTSESIYDEYSGHFRHYKYLFAELGPQYIQMWEGSWSALQRKGPDYIRQAAHSGRELLMQVLEFYAPDSCFSNDEIRLSGHAGKPTRKMRVQKALQNDSKSTVNFADSLAKAVDEGYGLLAAASHYRDAAANVTEAQLAALLDSLGGLLRFIYFSRNREQ